MYLRHRTEMFQAYNAARNNLIGHPEVLIELEKYITDTCSDLLSANYREFEFDYNEASHLQPFWANYPPEDRGRSPVGDQVPWIEVGEHAIGHKLCRLISAQHNIREIGLPSGADNRFMLSAPRIRELSEGLTDSVMVFLDIKSVGPRDDFEHTVLSPYQVSGDGIWDSAASALRNSQMTAHGKITEHPFYPAVAPIYVLSNGTIAPNIHVFIKPVYTMLSLGGNGEQGQPLQSIRVICVPNGLLLTVNPGYLQRYPGLFFPGKDDKGKQAEKVRCRVSFDILNRLADWRVRAVTNGRQLG